MHNPHTRRIELSPDEFFGLVDGGKKQVAGRVIIAALGFNPEICKLIVADDGSLCFLQKGKATAAVLKPSLWSRVQ